MNIHNIQRNRKYGFTNFELIIIGVITILLVAVIIPKFLSLKNETELLLLKKNNIQVYSYIKNHPKSNNRTLKELIQELNKNIKLKNPYNKNIQTFEIGQSIEGANQTPQILQNFQPGEIIVGNVIDKKSNTNGIYVSSLDKNKNSVIINYFLINK